MIVKDLRRTDSRMSGTIYWETAAREPFEAYIRLGEVSHQEWLSHQVSHPFLIAALLPAMRHGEERIRVEGDPVDPFLLDQLRSVMALAHAWWGDEGHYEPAEIEAELADYAEPSSDRVAASFLTGGVDSLATLRNNRMSIPRSHPKSIEKNILVYGFDLGLGGRSSEERSTSMQKFREVQEALQPITQSAGTELIPVYTNLRYLDEDNDFYTRKWHGSLLASIAHALDGKVHTVYIGSSKDFENRAPWGSSPLMDPLFSGTKIQVHHDGTGLSRLEKVRMLSGWSKAINNVRCCFVNKTGKLNCGECEKCVKTKVELHAIGALQKSEAFKNDEISVDYIYRRAKIKSSFSSQCYEEVIAPLRKRGEGELADAVKLKVQEYRSMRQRVEERDWRGVIKRILRALNLYY